MKGVAITLKFQLKFLQRFKGHPIHVISSEDGRLWLLGNDVTDALGFTRAKRTLRKCVKPKDIQKLNYRKYHQHLAALWRRSDYMPKYVITKAGALALAKHVQPTLAKQFHNWLNDRFGNPLPTKTQTAFIKAFKYHNNVVHILKYHHHYLFLGLDIGRILAYHYINNAIHEHVERSDRFKIRTYKDHQTRQLVFITRAGVYALIENSKLPKAHEFRHWLNHRVLPSIANKGYYLSPSARKADNVEFHRMLKYYLSIPKSRALALAGRALIGASKDVKRLEDRNHQLKKLKPKAEQYNRYLNSKSLITTTLIAKDCGMSAVTLNQFLAEHKVIYRMGECWVLYAKYQNMGLAHYRYYNYDNQNQSKLLEWTPKGRLFIFNLVNKFK